MSSPEAAAAAAEPAAAPPAAAALETKTKDDVAALLAARKTKEQLAREAQLTQELEQARLRKDTKTGLVALLAKYKEENNALRQSQQTAQQKLAAISAEASTMKEELAEARAARKQAADQTWGRLGTVLKRFNPDLEEHHVAELRAAKINPDALALFTRTLEAATTALDQRVAADKQLWGTPDGTPDAEMLDVLTDRRALVGRLQEQDAAERQMRQIGDQIRSALPLPGQQQQQAAATTQQQPPQAAAPIPQQPPAAAATPQQQPPAATPPKSNLRQFLSRPPKGPAAPGFYSGYQGPTINWAAANHPATAATPAVNPMVAASADQMPGKKRRRATPEEREEEFFMSMLQAARDPQNAARLAAEERAMAERARNREMGRLRLQHA